MTDISLVAVTDDNKLTTTKLLDNQIDIGFSDCIHVTQNSDSITIFAVENIEKERNVSYKRNVKTIKIGLKK